MLLAVLAACVGGHRGPGEDCVEVECRAAWAAAHWPEAKRQVRDLVAAEQDPMGRARIVEAVFEAWPGEAEALCGLLSPGVTRERCETVHQRADLLRLDPDDPAAASSTGEAAWILAPSPTMRPVDLPPPVPVDCGPEVPERSCRWWTAGERAGAGQVGTAAAVCAGLADARWRGVCLVDVVRRTCTPETPEGCGMAVEPCVAAGPLRTPCLIEVSGALAATAPASESPDPNGWAALTSRLREVERRFQDIDPMLGEGFVQRTWAEATMLAYGQSRIPAGDPLDHVPAIAVPHVRAAIAWRQATQKMEGNLQARADAVGAAMLRRSQRTGARPMPRGRVRIAGYWAETLPGEEEFASIPYLQNARRAWSADPDVDRRLCVLEASARVIPLDLAMLVEGLGAEEVVVRWTAARLLSQLRPDHAALAHVRGDSDPRVRARAARR
ncbi:MAG: hypothetical protein D6798_15575 [Deltaproteobacteria bacterium]|nr:MAG: hypothetical protein D6798_15575 [Deltaproteobacteria bacterium]